MVTNHKRIVRISLFLFSAALCSLAVAAQPAQKSRRGSTTTTKTNKLLGRSDKEAALHLLGRLRAIRDCWIDPYAMLPAEYPNDNSEIAFYGCSEYALRLAEARAAVDDAVEINSPAIRREAIAAIDVFNDLDVLRQFFNRNLLSSLTKNASVSEIYPIVHKYNITYSQDKTTKAEIFRQMMPRRRVRVDRLASLISDAPADSNPTLTADQALAANDDLTWARATRDMAYEWYLRWYPQGRHAAEARNSIARKSEIQKERDDQLEKIRAELEATTRKVLEAYVRGDKATYGTFLSNRFPARDIYIARLKAQPEVSSFEIRDFQVRRLHNGQNLYRATMNVQYRSMFKKERQYRNSILYLKTDRGWEIVEWQSHIPL